jgi:hypothetical protein
MHPGLDPGIVIPGLIRDLRSPRDAPQRADRATPAHGQLEITLSVVELPPSASRSRSAWIAGPGAAEITLSVVKTPLIHAECDLDRESSPYPR